MDVGIGLPILVPDAGPRTAIEFARRAEEAGAHSVWVGDRLVFAPPLVIESHDIDEIGQRLERALDDVARDLKEDDIR